jgi:hypothetical protein
VPVIHNLRSVILYHSKRVRPDTLRRIKEAIDSGDNAQMIEVDPSEMDCFTQMIFFEPQIQDAIDDKDGKPRKKGREKIGA